MASLRPVFKSAQKIYLQEVYLQSKFHYCTHYVTGNMKIRQSYGVIISKEITIT